MNTLEDIEAAVEDDTRRSYRRPWHDEFPWRYVCPDCEGYMINKLIDAAHGDYGKIRTGQWGKEDRKEIRTKQYYCEGCNGRKKQLWDVRDERLAKP